MAGGVRAGKAFVEFSITGIRRVRNDLNRLELIFSRLARNATLLGVSLTAVGASLGSVFGSAIREFARTEQLLGRFSSVFGELTNDAGAFADALSKSVGQSSLVIRDNLARYQALLQGAGLGGVQALPISKALTAATEDLIAFDDTISSVDEAQRRLVSGIVGETEAVRRTIGADVRASQVDLELLRLGYEGFAKSAPESFRQIARFNIIIRALARSGAAGQAAREINTLATGFRIFQANLRDARSAVGEALQGFASILSVVNGLIAGFAEWAKTNQSVIQSIAILSLLVPALGASLIALGVAALSVSTIFSIAASATTVIAGFTAFAGLSGTLIALAASAALFVGSLRSIISNLRLIKDGAEGAFASLNKLVAFVGQDLDEAFQAIGRAFQTGDFEQAFEILSLTLKVIIQEAGQFFRLEIDILADYIKRVLGDALSDVVTTQLIGPLRLIPGFGDLAREKTSQLILGSREELLADAKRRRAEFTPEASPERAKLKRLSDEVNSQVTSNLENTLKEQKLFSERNIRARQIASAGALATGTFALLGQARNLLPERSRNQLNIELGGLAGSAANLGRQLIGPRAFNSLLDSARTAGEGGSRILGQIDRLGQFQNNGLLTLGTVLPNLLGTLPGFIGRGVREARGQLLVLGAEATKFAQKSNERVTGLRAGSVVAGLASNAALQTFEAQFDPILNETRKINDNVQRLTEYILEELELETLIVR